LLDIAHGEVLRRVAAALQRSQQCQRRNAAMPQFRSEDHEENVRGAS